MFCLWLISSCALILVELSDVLAPSLVKHSIGDVVAIEVASLDC
jgi:hypothetical protein